MRRTLLYLYLPTFFGLTQEYRKHLFDQLHQITFFGKGGYSFTELYELPIHIRKYIFHTIKEHYERENKPKDGVEDLTSKIKSGAVKVPDYAKGSRLKYNGG